MHACSALRRPQAPVARINLLTGDGLGGFILVVLFRALDDLIANLDQKFVLFQIVFGRQTFHFQTISEGGLVVI